MYRKPALCAALLLVFCGKVRAQNDPNLVGYWNFDDGAVTDLSGNGNNGIFMGQATVADLPELVFGGSGHSLDVNYQNSNTDWVEIPHSESLNVTDELTVLAWIRPDDIENNDGVITKGTERASWALRFNITNGLRFTANAGFNLNDPTSTNYAPGAVGSGDRQSIFEVPEVNVPAGIDWTLIGVVSDTESLRFVLNLEEEELPAKYIFAESDEPLVLGAYLPGDDYFNGLIDEIRIYNRALTRREIITVSGLAEKPFEPVPENGAVGVTSGDLTWGSIEGTDQLYIGANPDALELIDGDAAGSHTIADTVAGRTYYWRVDVLTTDGTVTGDLWSFTMTEDAASGPTPSSNAGFVDVDGLSFGWLPVVGATAFDVYFGSAPDALELLGRVTENSYQNPDTTLVSETVHYWRVDTIKNGDVTTGQVWSFKTMPVFAVEEALAAWYKFELGEGTTAVDWTRKGNEGVLVGDTKWVEEGFSGGALEFDGAADYVEIPRVVQDDWTIMLWLRTENLEQSWPGRLGTVSRVRNGVGLIDGDAGGPAPNFAFSLNGNQIVANCMADGQGDGDSLASNTRVTTGDWIHAAWARDATTGEMSLYIDGTLDNSGQNDKWKGTKDSQGFIWIGGLQFGNRQQYLDGRLDEVKFFTRVLDEAEIKDEMRPDKRIAFLIEPAVGAVLEQEIPVLLAWVPGDGVTAHNVYVGTDKAQLPLVAPAHLDTVYDAAPLEPGTYFWQIGEIQADGAEVKGDIWSFVIADYLVVDDFEDYNDFAPSEIFNAWIDGWNIPANGSTVGYPNPDFSAGEHYVETTVVHEGAQSMPFFYDNDLKYSEATLSLTSGRDWTRLGVSVLSLWFRGHPASVGRFAEGPVGTYTVTGSGADIWNEADELHYVYEELSGSGSIIARVESVENTHNWAKAGVMIRDSLDADSAHGIMLVSAAQGVAFQRRSIAGQSTIGTTEAGIGAPHWVKIERDIGGMMSASHSADGISWTPLANEIITMNVPVYIGLAVTSHDADATCEAVFSNVQISGSASQQWASQDIGMINNDPEPMYIAVANSTGPAAKVYHDNPSAAQTYTWTEWNIELKGLADQGVDLTGVERLSIGFGDADNIQAGGSGLVFFDDVRLK